MEVVEDGTPMTFRTKDPQREYVGFEDLHKQWEERASEIGYKTEQQSIGQIIDDVLNLMQSRGQLFSGQKHHAPNNGIGKGVIQLGGDEDHIPADARKFCVSFWWARICPL